MVHRKKDLGDKHRPISGKNKVSKNRLMSLLEQSAPLPDKNIPHLVKDTAKAAKLLLQQVIKKDQK